MIDRQTDSWVRNSCFVLFLMISAAIWMFCVPREDSHCVLSLSSVRSIFLSISVKLCLTFSGFY